jgi:hypothetical protein
MRDYILQKIDEIREESSPLEYAILNEQFKYVHEGEEKSVEITSGEKLYLQNFASTFFSEDPKNHIPEIEDDVEIEIFAHSHSRWIDKIGVDRIQWLEESNIENVVSNYMGMNRENRFTKMTFHSNADNSHYWSFMENSTLYLFPISDSGSFKDVLFGGFPVPYLCGFVEDPTKINWKPVNGEAFTTYLREFADEEERKLLFLAYFD